MKISPLFYNCMFSILTVVNSSYTVEQFIYVSLFIFGLVIFNKNDTTEYSICFQWMMIETEAERIIMMLNQFAL